METTSKLLSLPGWIKSLSLTGKASRSNTSRDHRVPGFFIAGYALMARRETHSHPILRLRRRRKRRLCHLWPETGVTSGFGNHHHLLHCSAFAHLQDQQCRRRAAASRIAILHGAQVALGKLLRNQAVISLAFRRSNVGIYGLVSLNDPAEGNRGISGPRFHFLEILFSSPRAGVPPISNLRHGFVRHHVIAKTGCHLRQLVLSDRSQAVLRH